FVPDRWMSKTKMVRHTAAFTPCAVGQHSCLECKLAMDIMRLVIAIILKKFFFRLAPGDDGD
ncbi:hypothetical protein BJ878DRAFT_428182, partial [Calycina marina]